MQKVGDEVLARGTNVEWIEVGEGTSQAFQFVLRDVGGHGEGVRSENVVPDLSVIYSKMIPKGPGVLPSMLAIIGSHQ